MARKKKTELDKLKETAVKKSIKESVNKVKKASPIKNPGNTKKPKPVGNEIKDVKGGPLPHSRTLSKNRRVRIIMQELLFGNNTGNLVPKYTEEWGVKPSTINSYCCIANKLIIKSVQTDPEAVKIDVLSKLNELFRLSMSVGDRIEARRVLETISKIIINNPINMNIQKRDIESIKIVEMVKEVDKQDLIEAGTIEPDTEIIEDVEIIDDNSKEDKQK